MKGCIIIITYYYSFLSDNAFVFISEPRPRSGPTKREQCVYPPCDRQIVHNLINDTTISLIISQFERSNDFMNRKSKFVVVVIEL